MVTSPPWEDESGVRVLRFFKSKQHAEWPQAVNKSDLFPPCPWVVALDLDSGQFQEFLAHGPLQFSAAHNLFPQKILWMSPCAMPPVGLGIPEPAPGTRWTVVYTHTCESLATCAACPQSTVIHKTRRGARK